jgi:CheY-like chemotaxis protein
MAEPLAKAPPAPKPCLPSTDTSQSRTTSPILGARHGTSARGTMNRSSARKTILVVDDEVLIRMAISTYLRDRGYKVIEATNADEALTVLEHLDVKVDVVFSDIDMPGSMDGFELSTWIRRNRPGPDVILAGTVKRALNAAEELCKKDTLAKPYEPQAVLSRIKHLMAQRSVPKRD